MHWMSSQPRNSYLLHLSNEVMEAKTYITVSEWDAFSGGVAWNGKQFLKEPSRLKLKKEVNLWKVMGCSLFYTGMGRLRAKRRLIIKTTFRLRMPSVMNIMDLGRVMIFIPTMAVHRLQKSWNVRVRADLSLYGSTLSLHGYFHILFTRKILYCVPKWFRYR